MHFHHFWHGLVLGFGLIAGSAAVVYLMWRVFRNSSTRDPK
jgi:hypothetical protein